MIKKAITGPQVVNMNRLDFDKAGGGKKAGFSFLLEFKNGRVNNRYTSQMAKELVDVLQNDELVMTLMARRGFQLEMNPKCELKITLTADQALPPADISAEPMKAVEPSPESQL